MHVAQVGIGRVGRPTAYAIMNTNLVDTLTVCDTKPGLASAFAEELRHVNASTGANVEVISCDKDEQVAGADIILISAGKARPAGVKMSRRDLAVENARIVKTIAEATVHRNPGAKYIVITNPVDAMGMVCKKYTKAEYVISTGTNLESLRFRAKIAQSLRVPVSQVQGWVGGEHGDAAVPLWSTTKVGSIQIEEYSQKNGLAFSKLEIESYVKAVSKIIVDNIGATEFGPAASFRDITRAVIEDTRQVLSVAAPFKEDADETFVGIPRPLGKTVEPSIYNVLTTEEQQGIRAAAKAIRQTYELATENLSKIAL
ncbi:MAG: malate dehydrogenase [Candidatus Bathyarchaeia archaeon]